MTTTIETFDGGANGVALTTTTAPNLTLVDVDTVSGATALHTSTTPVEGTRDVLLAGGSPGGVARVSQALPGAVNRAWSDTTFALTATLSAPNLLNRFFGGPARGSVRLNVDGSVALRNGTSVVATSPAGLIPADGTPCRVAVDFNFGAGTATVGIFVGSARFGTSPTVTLTGAATLGNVQTVWHGLNDPVAGSSMRLVRAAVSDSAAIAPPTAPVVTEDQSGWLLGAVVF